MKTTAKLVDLRWLADAYEQAQSIRVATAERIRAVLQGRDKTWGNYVTDVDPDIVLKSIAKGEELGPVPLLGLTYYRHKMEEDELRKEMDLALQAHPAWPWMSRIKGIGPTLGAKVLAHFDPHLADHASSFWAFAGLATVPGESYHCETCGLTCAWPVGYNVTGVHQMLGSPGAWKAKDDEIDEKKKCKGKLVKVAGPEDGVRTAQPRPAKGQKSPYDQYAKKVMYLLGSSFIKAGEGPYEAHYRKHRARLEVERPGWADGRKHFTALRITEKLFLAHLWQIWREALGLPTGDPYAMAELGHTGFIDPWSMVEE